MDEKREFLLEKLCEELEGICEKNTFYEFVYFEMKNEDIDNIFEIAKTVRTKSFYSALLINEFMRSQDSFKDLISKIKAAKEEIEKPIAQK